MIKEFTVANQAEAVSFYKSCRSALARIIGGKIFVFTPASSSIGHQTGHVIDQGTVRRD